MQLPAWTWDDLEEAMSIFESSDDFRGRHFLALLRSQADKAPDMLLREILCTAAVLGDLDSTIARLPPAESSGFS